LVVELLDCLRQATSLQVIGIWNAGHGPQSRTRVLGEWVKKCVVYTDAKKVCESLT
jgi:hypothetical protein